MEVQVLIDLEGVCDRCIPCVPIRGAGFDRYWPVEFLFRGAVVLPVPCDYLISGAVADIRQAKYL